MSWTVVTCHADRTRSVILRSRQLWLLQLSSLRDSRSSSVEVLVCLGILTAQPYVWTNLVQLGFGGEALRRRIVLLAPSAGLEPATPGAGGQCSIR